MANRDDEHAQTILEQFGKQAVPFSRMQDSSAEEILAASGVSADDAVLDVACGPGLMACAFAAVARQVTGIDVTPAMIERARALQASRGLGNLTWHVGDVAGLRSRDGAFSLVFSRYSFHHFLAPAAVLAEMVRVCAPGGRVVIVDVFTRSPEQAAAFDRMERLRDPSHARALSLAELTGLAQRAGLREIETRFYEHAFELEQVLRGSFPKLGDAERVRDIFVEDLGRDALGLGVHQQDQAIHFAYPVVIVVGRKP